MIFLQVASAGVSHSAWCRAAAVEIRAMMSQPASDSGDPFEPVFVVGSPRSCAPLLSTLLDRHSRIAIPPETHFFGHFRRRIGRDHRALQHHALADEFLRNRRARDMKLDRAAILSRFSRYPADLPNLL